MATFPKDDRFAEYVFDRDESQTQSEDVEIPFRREVATDFKTLEDREKFAKMYDEDRESELALANKKMQDLMDEWKGVKRRKEVEDFVGSDDMLSISNLRKKYPNITEDYSDEELKDKSPKYRGSKEELKDFLDPKYIKDESGELAKPSMSDEEFMKQEVIKKMNQKAVDAANERLQAANAPKSDDGVMGDIEAQEANLKKQLKDGIISQDQFDLKQADLMAKAQGLGLAGEREMASRGEDREVAGIASPDQEQKEIVNFTGMTEKEKLEYLRDQALQKDRDMTFLDNIMKFGSLANKSLITGGGYEVGQSKLPSLKTDEASRFSKLLKDYNDLNKKESLSTYQKMMLEAKAKEQSAKSERERRIARKQQLDAARGLLKDDPRTKKSYEQAMAMEDIAPLIEQVKSGNEVAAASLGARLARAMGEVGVLTDTDVTRYVGGTTWGRQLKDWYSKRLDGDKNAKISEDTLKDIIKNAKTLSSKMSKNLDNVYSNAEKRMKTAYPDLDDKTIKGLLGRPNITSKPSSNEVRRNVKKGKNKGKVAIFDRDTKKFLRYEE